MLEEVVTRLVSTTIILRAHHQQWSSGLLSVLFRYTPVRACPDFSWQSLEAVRFSGVASGLPFSRRLCVWYYGRIEHLPVFDIALETCRCLISAKAALATFRV